MAGIPQSNEEPMWLSKNFRMDPAGVGGCLLTSGRAAAAAATVSGRGCVEGRGLGPLQRCHPHSRATARTTQCSGPDPGGGDAPFGHLLHNERQPDSGGESLSQVASRVSGYRTIFSEGLSQPPALVAGVQSVGPQLVSGRAPVLGRLSPGAGWRSGAFGNPQRDRGR